jgi:hypothetical protein
MNEMLVRAQLHRSMLGEGRASEAARLFADRIDNPAVLERVDAIESGRALVAARRTRRSTGRPVTTSPDRNELGAQSGPVVARISAN